MARIRPWRCRRCVPAASTPLRDGAGRIQEAFAAAGGPAAAADAFETRLLEGQLRRTPPS
jgi:hypothetical protein